MHLEEVPADPHAPVLKAYLKRVHSAGIPSSSNGRAVSRVPARSRERGVIPNKACSTLQHAAAGDRRSIRQESWFPSPPFKTAEVFRSSGLGQNALRESTLGMNRPAPSFTQ